MNNNFSVGIFISGGGSFAAYAKRSRMLEDISIKIIADREVVKQNDWVDEWLIKASVSDYWDRFQLLSESLDLVFLNFNWIVPPAICKRLKGKLINHHPALLPAFKGLNIFDNILESGTRISGSTFHFVTKNVDDGPIIAQSIFPVEPDDTVEILQKKNYETSKDLYVQVIRWMADDRIVWHDTTNRVVVNGARYMNGGSIPDIEI